MRNIRRRHSARLARPEWGAHLLAGVDAIPLRSLMCSGMPRVEQLDTNADRRGANRKAYEGATIQSFG